MTNANPPPPVIRLRGLQKRFGIGDAENFAINDIDLTIKKGEFVAIMGPSGCGKTTLLNIIGLLDQSIDGEYELNGESVADMSKLKKARIRSQQIGFIFQNFNLVPHRHWKRGTPSYLQGYPSYKTTDDCQRYPT